MPGLIFYGAGDGNRTRVISLEGWSSTIEPHPHFARRLLYRKFADYQRDCQRNSSEKARASLIAAMKRRRYEFPTFKARDVQP